MKPGAFELAPLVFPGRRWPRDAGDSALPTITELDVSQLSLTKANRTCYQSKQSALYPYNPVPARGVIGIAEEGLARVLASARTVYRVPPGPSARLDQATFLDARPRFVPAP